MLQRLIAFACAIPLAAIPAAAEQVEFLNALDNSPLTISLRVGEHLTPTVEAFIATGENRYSGDAEAMEAGKKVYKRFCQACHLPDGSGRIGPNLRDDQWVYERTGTEIGRFEIIYGGGAGAMQAFGGRMNQDDILKVMAYIATFRE